MQHYSAAPVVAQTKALLTLKGALCLDYKALILGLWAVSFALSVYMTQVHLLFLYSFYMISLVGRFLSNFLLILILVL